MLELTAENEGLRESLAEVKQQRASFMSKLDDTKLALRVASIQLQGPRGL